MLQLQVKNFQEPEEGKEADKDAAAAPTTAAAAAAAAVAAVPAPVVPVPPPVTTRPLEKPEDEKYTVSPWGLGFRIMSSKGLGYQGFSMIHLVHRDNRTGKGQVE